MTIKLLTNPLSKGEKWESKDSREIEITKSSSDRGLKPNVYFGITKMNGKNKKITEDFLLPTDLAIKLGKALIQQALDIEKDKGISISLRYSSPAEKKEFKNN